MTGAANDLLKFIEASPTPFHAVAALEMRLRAAGFRQLDEADVWQIKAGDRLWVTRGGSSLVAFVVGTQPLATSGMRLIGAHTDSPNLRLKSLAWHEAQGYRRLGVEVYGGVLLSTWMDRDLGLAGRLHGRGADGVMRSCLLRSPQAIGRIANLAIHLDREVNQNGLKLNPQLHLLPIIGLSDGAKGDFRQQLSRWTEGASDAVPADGWLDGELCLFDMQPPAIGGLDGEFIFAPRLDNLAGCHAALTALLQSHAQDTTLGIALFDHEECGSQSAQGAASDFLGSVLQRLAPPGDAEALARARARSWLLSVDMAHGLHPNFADRHDAQLAPLLGGGPVLKRNANQAYGTDAAGAAWLRSIAADHGIALQDFAMRSDLRCGSTIGPILATRLGLRCIDLGSPMLSMHSCREMAATADVQPLIGLLAACLNAATPLPCG